MTIEVTGPDGSRISFPDGTDAGTINSVMSQHFGVRGDARPQQSYGGGLFRQGLQGLSFNAADEIEAALPFMRNAGEDYNAAVTRIRRGNERFAQENPIASFTANVAGGVPLLALGPGAAAARWTMAARALPTGAVVAGPLGTQTARSAGLGAATGAAYGLGAGEGSLAQRAPSALQGAAFGGGIGAAAPVVAQGIGATWGRLQSARAGQDPHARVAAGLGEQTVDDLANAASVGVTRHDVAINRPVLDILGEEMVRANGNREAAVQAATARLVANGVEPATAQDQIRRVITAQRGNDLLLGEYPAVATADMATRNRNPYAPRGQVGQDASTIFQEEFTRAGGDRAAAARSTLDRMTAAGVPRRDATRVVRDILRGRVTSAEVAATTEPGTQQIMDYVANAGSMASSQNTRAAITQRATNLGERMLGLVRGLAPGGRSIRDVEDMVGQVRQRMRADYDAAHNTPGATNQGVLFAGLNRAITRSLARLQGRGGEAAQALRSAVDGFYVTQPAGTAAKQAAAASPSALPGRIAIPLLQEDLAASRLALKEARRQSAPRETVNQMSREIDDIVERIRIAQRDSAVATGRSLPTSLQVVQDMRGELRGMITEARRGGRDHIVQVLQPLYDDITRIMERSNPAWGAVNRRWADMRVDEVAAELGDALATRAGPRLREQLRQFQQLAPEAQDIARVHFTQKLIDEVEHEIRLAGQTNLGKLFERQDKLNMIRAILGDDAANAIVRATRDANVMARSMAGIRGSQTHIRGQVQREQDADIGAVSAAANLDWRNWRQMAFEYVMAAWRESRNRAMSRTLTTPMRDVPAVAEQIARMRQAATRVEQANQPRLPPSINRGLLPFIGPAAPVSQGPAGR
jgi:hypothetical protein